MTESVEKSELKPASSAATQMEAKPKKFSEFLTSPVFAIIVGADKPKTFQIHSALLIHESDRLAKDVTGGFNEEGTKTVVLDEEDPELFGYFVEYLYRDGWVTKEAAKHNTDYVVLARLYALAERLQAKVFQRAALRQFTASFNSGLKIPDQSVCDLLDIACGELPERVEEDPLRAQIFWFAALHLTQLREYGYFLRLLDLYKDLGKMLCLRAGNGSQHQPGKTSEPVSQRFKAESIFDG
ncbi:MAG: hypothetical protein MMC33_003326 [Icmadophila ericetorum]|nr:hypothetical protein [Icmadophila ericetorum]